MTRIRNRATVTTAILGLTLLGLVPLSAHARGGRGGPPSPERAVQRLTDRLELSAEQQEQVQTILEESFEQRRELRDRHHLERDAMRDAAEDRLSAVLTDAQLDELRELREDRRERRRDCDRRGGRWERRGPEED